MYRKVITYGHPTLRKKAQPIKEITAEVRQLAEELQATCLKDGYGVGLAATQVDVELRIFFAWIPSEKGWDPEEVPAEERDYRIFINPKIIEVSEETEWRDEGCLSIPGLRGVVERPVEVQVEYMDIEGKIQQDTLTNLGARVFLHENDHLNGVLFIDRLEHNERRELEPGLQKLKKKRKAALKKKR